MIGLHAEILGFLHPTHYTSRSTLLSLYPRSVHPDAIHKAITDLVRSGVVTATSKGLVLTQIPADDDSQDRDRCKAQGSENGKKTQRKRKLKLRPAHIPLYDENGLRYCVKCEAHLPKTAFAYRSVSSDRLAVYCRMCVAASRSGANARHNRPPRYNQLGLRHCGHCDQYLPTHRFGTDHASKDGLKTHCKSCRNAQWSQAKREARRSKCDDSVAN